MEAYKIGASITAVINGLLAIVGLWALPVVAGLIGLGHQGVRHTGIFWQLYLFIALDLLYVACAIAGCVAAIRYFKAPSTKHLSWMVVTTIATLLLPLYLLVAIVLRVFFGISL